MEPWQKMRGGTFFAYRYWGSDISAALFLETSSKG